MWYQKAGPPDKHVRRTKGGHSAAGDKQVAGQTARLYF